MKQNSFSPLASGAFLSFSLLALASCMARQPQVIYVQGPAQGAPGAVAQNAQPAAEVSEQRDAPAQPAAKVPAQRDASTPPAVATSLAPSVMSPSHSQPAKATGPFQECDIERFASGWTTLACPNANVVVYGGFASQPKADWLRSTAQDYIKAEYSKLIPSIVGESKAWELTSRKRKAKPGLLLDETVADPDGEILRQATFTKVHSNGPQALGVLCYADAPTYRRERCQELTRTLLQEGVPGPVASKDIRIAGVTLKLKGKQCWAPTPSNVHCLSDGALHWKRGTPHEMEAFAQARMHASGLFPMSDSEREKMADVINSRKSLILAGRQLNEFQKTGNVTTQSVPQFTSKDISQRRITRHPATCRIGGQEARCERIDYYGVLDYVVKHQYIAIAEDPDGAEAVALSCQQRYNQVAPLACREVFGSFIEPPKPSRN
tara:strand:- start:6416 stop:7720 length:1305 start_codon:yes stop_codon:yes gene_type:complete